LARAAADHVTTMLPLSSRLWHAALTPVGAAGAVSPLAWPCDPACRCTIQAVVATARPAPPISAMATPAAVSEGTRRDGPVRFRCTPSSAGPAVGHRAGARGGRATGRRHPGQGRHLEV